MSQGDHGNRGRRPAVPDSPAPSSKEQMREQDILHECDGAALDPMVQAQLGRVFRAYCEDLIHQPIPDKLAVLLAQLEAKQRERE